ncbi:2OG-Fe(II) oxygenase [Xanthomonas hyacinthi]|uniref:Prolyl 4-hydroxylase alpha subunit domain-containing protein n=1 Tax=Xanthomonas hyacinthi TaxID=56455 RepID=A0A2S7ENP9_9XANT|nr:2OG-Fe(II) oxygenase [Xanthomonas hyacinthi]KLD75672.1 hypothetical protein Y886_25615 [Xanthomonas hyacinthi DSM 19077]PPU93408.1 hypothetical protein XhyaCFBP1156_20735 [Xanthomonas hyacinthi]QGY77916.1 2OG-Fe(II) oxygenase [Xanthomonas hyacinthi]
MVSEDYQNQLLTELRQQGYDHNEICGELVQMGLDKAYVEQLLSKVASEEALDEARPEPDITGHPSSLSVAGREVKLLMFTRKPRCYFFADFMSAEDCERLIEISKTRMKRSVVYSADENGVTKVVPSYTRSSNQANYVLGDSDFTDEILSKVSELTNWPTKKMEGIQVIQYGIGGEFVPHCDFFLDSSDGEEMPWQRVGTFLIYLNRPTYGGSTFFPDAHFEFIPHQGNSLLFSYEPGDINRDLSRHAGTPVGGGSKWLATILLTDRDIENGVTKGTMGGRMM